MNEIGKVVDHLFGESKLRKDVQRIVFTMKSFFLHCDTFLLFICASVHKFSMQNYVAKRGIRRNSHGKRLFQGHNNFVVFLFTRKENNRTNLPSENAVNK